MQSRLIRELMVYEFELHQNTAKAFKNIIWAKREGAVDHSK